MVSPEVGYKRGGLLINRLLKSKNLGRVLINESRVSGRASMSALHPTPVANSRMWTLPPVARNGH